MIKGFAVLLVCLIAGECIAHIYRLPLPGSICGLAILFGCLAWRGGPVSSDIANTTDGLLANLGLLFVPAGVGIMTTWDLVVQDWLVISIALVVSTAVAIAVTALTAVWIATKVVDAAPPRHAASALNKNASFSPPIESKS